MNANRKRTILLFIIGSAGAFILFNLLEHLLEGVEISNVPGWLSAPFVLLLLSIAVVPFINRHWWEKKYPWISFGLGALVLLYYIFSIQNIPRLFLTFYEYVSFLSLIGSLFVVSGGIHLRIRGKATPMENVSLLAIGAIISNLLGTTGASMILIRPFLRLNHYRVKGYHVVFFIFIVSNFIVKSLTTGFKPSIIFRNGF